MNSKNKAYIIEAVTPLSDTDKFFAGTTGWAGSWIMRTAKREEAKHFPTKQDAQVKCEELFNPGFMRVVLA